jgi:hypothetical protein
MPGLTSKREDDLGRTPVRRVEPTRARRLNGLLVAGGIIVLLFAVFGVASAGKLVADNMSSSKTPTPTPSASAGVSPDITRAHAQATAIVKAAQASEHAIVSRATTKAHRTAAQIIANARKSAAAAPTAVSGTSSSTTVPLQVQPTAVASTGGSTVAPAAPVPGLRGTPVGAPNLAGIPAAWLVVGYNPTFGSGPGSAGGVGVVNRGNVPFSGTVRIAYNHGGTAVARFSRLAPGQSLILPLNGPAYPGGGFVMRVIV